jgi:hypothetical protein
MNVPEFEMRTQNIKDRISVGLCLTLTLVCSKLSPKGSRKIAEQRLLLAAPGGYYYV